MKAECSHHARATKQGCYAVHRRLERFLLSCDQPKLMLATVVESNTNGFGRPFTLARDDAHQPGACVFRAAHDRERRVTAQQAVKPHLQIRCAHKRLLPPQAEVE